ncbi:Histone H4 [Asimina triloba]
MLLACIFFVRFGFFSGRFRVGFMLSLLYLIVLSLSPLPYPQQFAHPTAQEACSPGQVVLGFTKPEPGRGKEGKGLGKGSAKRHQKVFRENF